MGNHPAFEQPAAPKTRMGAIGRIRSLFGRGGVAPAASVSPVMQDVAGAAMVGTDVLWAIREQSLNEMRALAALVDVEARLEAYYSAADEMEARRPYEMDGSTAVIPVCGPLMKGFSFWCWIFGGTSYDNLRSAMEYAANDEDVKRVRFVFDTPGGTVDGCAETARAIRDLAKQKKVRGWISDRCCSAGYWLASQCPKIEANAPTAEIGNIGVVACLDDLTQMFATVGIDRHVYRSTPLKGAGIPGTAITEAQDAEFQGLVDSTAALFVQDVAKGRGVDTKTVQDWATAHIYLSTEALSAGLIDGIAKGDTEEVEQVADDDRCPDADYDDEEGGDGKKPKNKSDKKGKDKSDTSDDDDDAGGEDDDEEAAMPKRPLRRQEESAAPEETPAATHPAFVNAPSDFDFQAFRHQAGGAPVIEPGSALAHIDNRKPQRLPVKQKPANAGKGNKQMSIRDLTVNALRRAGLLRMAAEAVGADDDAESQVRVIAEQVDAEVQYRLEHDPVKQACAAAGIHSVADLTRVLDQAKIGDDAVNAAKEGAKSEAIRAYGTETGLQIAAQLEGASYKMVQTLATAWRAEADKKYGIGENGQAANRVSAPARQPEALQAAGANDGKEKKSNWARLTPEQQRIAEKIISPTNVDGTQRTPKEMKKEREKLAVRFLSDMGLKTADDPDQEPVAA